MILPQFHHCDCEMCEWLNFGTFFSNFRALCESMHDFSCIVEITIATATSTMLQLIAIFGEANIPKWVQLLCYFVYDNITVATKSLTWLDRNHTNAASMRLHWCSVNIVTPYHNPELFLGLDPANERRRYFVTTSLIGWVLSWNKTCNHISWDQLIYTITKVNKFGHYANSI